MIQWELLDSVSTPDGEHQITLRRRGAEYSIRIDGAELMNSRRHGSESAMAALAYAELPARAAPRVLVGGLGMGFTLAAANAALPADAQIDAVEFLGAVITWNRGPMGELAGRPLDDPRVTAVEADVRAVLEASAATYDVVLLDVDNGPDGTTQAGNAWLYGAAGLARIHAALTPGGVLSVWSASPDRGFSQRLHAAGLAQRRHRVAARSNGKGPKHTIWVASKRR